MSLNTIDMKTLTTLFLLLSTIAMGQTKKPDDTLLLRQKRLNREYYGDTVKHVMCRCLIFDEKTHSLKQDSTHDMWIKGDSVHVGAFNPFKNKN